MQELVDGYLGYEDSCAYLHVLHLANETVCGSTRNAKSCSNVGDREQSPHVRLHSDDVSIPSDVSVRRASLSQLDRKMLDG